MGNLNRTIHSNAGIELRWWNGLLARLIFSFRIIRIGPFWVVIHMAFIRKVNDDADFVLD